MAGAANSFAGLDFQTGRCVRVTIEGATIRSVDPGERAEAGDLWVAPAFWDIQVNGRWGISFSDPALTPEQVAEVVRAQSALGTARVCPTLISAEPDATCHGLATIAEACQRWPDVARQVVGIHLEGPYLSELEGYRGAHRPEVLHDPDWSEFERFQQASGQRIVLVTLAPERAGALDFIDRLAAAGVAVAIGHTAADGPTILAAARAGARLSTHLGNGIASTLSRHPNPIWIQAACDEMWASFIADGHHVDLATLRVLVRAKTPARIILVSDASPLAGLPPGHYGDWEVDVSGKVVVAGTPYLAGSNQSLEVGLNNILQCAGLTLAEALATVTTHPSRLLRQLEPALEPGQPANLVRFRVHNGNGARRIELFETCVDGEWVASHAEQATR